MAQGQGQIKKGFFFYFGLFVLLLVSIFCICLVIMMFNPGQSVLGIRYFSGDGKTYWIEKTTVEEEEEQRQIIDWSSVTELVIDTNYADVRVERNADRKLPHDGLYIINNAKGFQLANSESTPYTYAVSKIGNKVNVEVKGASGFMFFSDKIEIILHATTEGKLNFSNLKLSIKTTGGDVSIGGNTTQAAEAVKLSSLKVSTGSGDIAITNYFDTTSINGSGTGVDAPFSLTSQDGMITSSRKVEYTDRNKQTKTGNGIALNVNAYINVEGKGLVTMPVIHMPGKTLSLTCKKGNMTFNHIEAESAKIVCVQGNHLYDEVIGTLSYSNSVDSILSPNIVAGYISGSFILTGNGSDANPDIDLTEVHGTISVVTKRGRLNVGEAYGSVDIDSDNLSIDIVFAKTLPVDSIIYIDNKSAGLHLTFNGNMPKGMVGSAYRTTIVAGGNVTIDFVSGTKFIARMHKYDRITDLEEDNVHLNIGNELREGQKKNPLIINGAGTSDYIDISTSKGVYFNVVSKK